MQVQRERHLLVVLAHPDDESFACGGTIALHTAAGTPVTYVCATRGEMGRRMGNPPFATRESLPHLREQELRAACAVLGIGDLRLLGYWDKTLEFADPTVLAERVGAILAEVRPSLLITFHPLYGGHPDHCAIGAATVRAVAALPPDVRPRVLCSVYWEIAQREGLQTEVVDITSVTEVKRAALRAHRSQFDGMEESIARRLGDPARVEQLRRELWEQERFVEYTF